MTNYGRKENINLHIKRLNKEGEKKIRKLSLKLSSDK